MSVALPSRQNKLPHFPARRTATTVMAGVFDVKPQRDVLTSLLNGVPPYKEIEGDDETRRAERREKKREKRRALAAQRLREREQAQDAQRQPEASTSFSQIAATNSSPSFWKARPAIHIPNMHQRSVSVSPPPSPITQFLPYSDASTPSPSESSSVTRTSSKRLRTPDDDDELLTASPVGKAIKKRPLPRPKRAPVRKGWKGWVEAPEDEITPSAKLINLDNIKVFEDRKTRSGKHFDAWV